MSDAFDPYYVWLGIPPDQQPPHHYRLLGVSVFESEPEVISTAADRQMAHVRKYQIGANSSASQRILNELATARRCLLDPQAKSDYDQQLRRREAKPASGRPQPASGPAASRDDKPTDAVLLADTVDDFSPLGASPSPALTAAPAGERHRLTALNQRPVWLLVAGSAVVGLLLCVVVIAVALGLRGGDEHPSPDDAGPAQRRIVEVNPDEVGRPARLGYLAVLEVCDDCLWSDGASFEQRHRLVAGEKLQLAAGHIEIQYQQGPKVILDGPAIFELTAADRGLLRQGRTTVVSASDEFAVATANGTRLDNNRPVLVHPSGSIVYLDETPAPRGPLVSTQTMPTAPRGLVGHWPFDDDGRDATGHGYDAAFRKSPSYVAGPVGRAVDLSQNHFNLDQTMLENAGQFTLATWVYLTRPTQAMLRQLGGEFLFSGGSVNLTVSKNNVQLFLIDITGKAGPGGFRHTENWPYDFTRHIGRWTHVALAYDQQAGQVECWIDGRSLGQRQTPNFPIRIANARFMMISGGVDDMRLYDVRLPDSAIKQLVTAGNAAVVTSLENPTPAVSPRPAPPSPTKTFDTSGLAQAVTLPPVEDTTPVDLGKIPAAAATSLTLALLGGDEAIKGAPLLALAAADAAEGQRVWQVHFSEDAETFAPVAEVRLSDEQLNVQWTAGVLGHAEAEALRNCLLRISAAGEQHIMRLREPVLVPPLAVDLVRGNHQAKIKLDAPPPLEEIYIELADIDVKFPGMPSLTESDRLVPLAGGKKSLNFGSGSNTLQLTVLGNTSSGIAVGLQTHFLVTTMSEPMLYTKGNIRKVGAPINQAIDRLIPQVAALRAERSKVFFTKRIREVNNQLAALEPQLDKLQQAKQQLLELSSAYDALHGNSKIQFRLKYAVGNAEVLLAESRDQPQE